MNLPTIIVLGIIVAVFIAIVIYQIKNRKEGKCPCGGSCSGCALNGTCHKES